MKKYSLGNGKFIWKMKTQSETQRPRTQYCFGNESRGFVLITKNSYYSALKITTQ